MIRVCWKPMQNSILVNPQNPVIFSRVKNLIRGDAEASQVHWQFPLGCEFMLVLVRGSKQCSKGCYPLNPVARILNCPAPILCFLCMKQICSHIFFHEACIETLRYFHVFSATLRQTWQAGKFPIKMKVAMGKHRFRRRRSQKRSL